MLTQKQKEVRATRIGGSEVAVVLGLSPWKNRYELWLEKTGRRQREGIGPIGDLGNYLEEFVAKEYLKRHPEHKLQRRKKTFYMPTVPKLDGEPLLDVEMDEKVADRMIAHVDREILCHPDGVGILECKTVGRNRYSNIVRDGVPETMWCQLVWYLMVTGRSHGVLAILNRATGDYMEYEVRPTAQQMRDILMPVALFAVQNLNLDEQPDNTTDYELPALSEETFVTEDDDWKTLVQDFAEAKQAEKEAKARSKELKSAVIAKVTEYGVEEIVGGGARVTYHQQGGGSQFDLRMFRAQHPEFDIEKFMMPKKPYRVLRFKMKGDK